MKKMKCFYITIVYDVIQIVIMMSDITRSVALLIVILPIAVILSHVVIVWWLHKL
jgi:hypothetical protein